MGQLRALIRRQKKCTGAAFADEIDAELSGNPVSLEQHVPERCTKARSTAAPRPEPRAAHFAGIGGDASLPYGSRCAWRGSRRPEKRHGQIETPWRHEPDRGGIASGICQQGVIRLCRVLPSAFRRTRPRRLTLRLTRSPNPRLIDYPTFYSYAYPESEGFRTSEVGPTESFSARNSVSFCCLMRRSEATSTLMQRFLPSCNRLTKPPLAAKRFPVSLDFGDGLIQINDDIADLDDDRRTTFTRFQRIADDKKPQDSR